MTAEFDDDLLACLEALLIVGDRPLSAQELASALDVPEARVRAGVAELQAELDGQASGATRIHGMELRQIAGGWAFAARAEYDDLLTAMGESREPARLSPAALETLAVVAYRQPIARGQIAEIRAVNVDSVVRTLQERGLIAEAFRDPETGAAMFETTPLLLTELGISDISELPAISPLLPGAEDVAAGQTGERGSDG